MAARRTAGLPVVAFVGRPNVGKSTLFNRIVGDDRAAIVEDRARTTRDRLYGDAEWNGRRFVVVDTGGLEISPGDPIEEQVQLQARLAIAEADVIVFVVDAATGPTPADLEAAALLRRTTKPVLVAANKADNERRELDATEFYAFGWEDTFAISANHGRGVGDLLDAIVWALPPGDGRGDRAQGEGRRGRGVGEGDGRGAAGARGERPMTTTTDDDDDDGAADPEDAEAARWDAMMAAEGDEPPGIAFVGRPNVGKSSLLNALLGETRTIVSRHAGDHPRRDRHHDPVGSQRDRPDRHRRHPQARQGRVGGPRPSATRTSARSRRSAVPTSRSSSSTPPTG